MKIFQIINSKLKAIKFYRAILLLIEINKADGFIKHTLITKFDLGDY